jgi:hypothetical protein
MADGGAATAIGAGAETVTGGGTTTATETTTTTTGTAPEWLGTLPDELKGDATLTRYKSVEDLARGHLETKRLAMSKLAIPGEGASDEDWGKVWSALGRPEKADGYGEFGLDPLPATATKAEQDARAAMVAGYQEQLHKLGVPGKLAGEIVKADIARIQGAQEAYYAKGAEEIAALKAELGGDYDTKVAAAKAVFAKLGLPVEFADELDAKVGSAALLKGFIKLAEATGEHGRVEGDGGQTGFGAAGGTPQERINGLFADKGWRAKYDSGDAGAVKQFEDLRKEAHRFAQQHGI